MTARLEGMDTVLRNLNQEVNGIKSRTMRGLLAAGKKIEGESNRRAPYATGNLTQHSYARKAQSGEMAVEVGYDTAYALYVHENVEQKLKGKPRPRPPGGHFWDKGQPKFLESAIRDKSAEILETIRQYAAVRK